MVKTIFYILAFLLSLGAAYFGFSTQGSFKEQKQAFDAVQKAKNGFNRSNDVRSKELEVAEGELAAADQTGSELEANIEAMKSDEGNLNRSVGQLEDEISGYDTQLEEFDNLIAEMRQLFPDGEINEIPGIIEKLEKEVDLSQKELDEKLIVADKLSVSVTTNQFEVQRLNNKISEIKQRIKANGLEARISSVDNRWGFVVINGVGSNNGISGDTKLVVHRGERFLGRLKISSLEPNQIVADIDKGTMAAGVRLSPGDRVILQEAAAN